MADNKPECTNCGALRSDLELRRIGKALWWLCPPDYHQVCSKAGHKVSWQEYTRRLSDARLRYSLAGWQPAPREVGW